MQSYTAGEQLLAIHNICSLNCNVVCSTHTLLSHEFKHAQLIRNSFFDIKIWMWSACTMYTEERSHDATFSNSYLSIFQAYVYSFIFSAASFYQMITTPITWSTRNIFKLKILTRPLNILQEFAYLSVTRKLKILVHQLSQFSLVCKILLAPRSPSSHLVLQLLSRLSSSISTKD